MLWQTKYVFILYFIATMMKCCIYPTWKNAICMQQSQIQSSNSDHWGRLRHDEVSQETHKDAKCTCSLHLSHCTSLVNVYFTKLMDLSQGIFAALWAHAKILRWRLQSDCVKDTKNVLCTSPTLQIGVKEGFINVKVQYIGWIYRILLNITHIFRMLKLGKWRKQVMKWMNNFGRSIKLVH
jgi:hypothetical protein